MGQRPRAGRVRRRFEVTGVVQGVGFRPFVYATATELGLTGSVRQHRRRRGRRGRGRRRTRSTSSAARLRDRRAAAGRGRGGRRVRAGRRAAAPASPSSTSGAGGAARTLASPDVAICADCLRRAARPGRPPLPAPVHHLHQLRPALHDHHRRCPTTGPATTMAGFAMCAACRREYDDPADRRFHAQPIACPDCGPRAASWSRRPGRHAATGDGRAARRPGAARRRADRRGQGLGGYHLACDARDEHGRRRAAPPQAARRQAVRGDGRRPRRRRATWSTIDRGRGAAADRHPRGRSCCCPAARRRPASPTRSRPATPTSACMLPYTPLHVLLLGLDGDPTGPDALVMTSGNLSGEPIVTDDAEALRPAGAARRRLAAPRPRRSTCRATTR